MKTSIFILLFSLVPMTFAQGSKTTIDDGGPAGEYQLRLLKYFPAQEGEKLCGPYFVLYADKSPNPQPNLTFYYKAGPKKKIHMGSVAKSKLTTIIDDSKRKPTAEILATKTTVRISVKDFSETRGCLPNP